MNRTVGIRFRPEDAEEELKRMEEFQKAQAEIEKENEKSMSQKMFKVVWYCYVVETLRGYWGVFSMEKYNKEKYNYS